MALKPTFLGESYKLIGSLNYFQFHVNKAHVMSCHVISLEFSNYAFDVKTARQNGNTAETKDAQRCRF